MPKSTRSIECGAGYVGKVGWTRIRAGLTKTVK